MKTLSENNGNKSSMRLCVLIATVSASVCAVLGVYRGVELLGLSTLCTGMLSSALGFKAYQKGKE